jgi:hypothetical protein
MAGGDGRKCRNELEAEEDELRLVDGDAHSVLHRRDFRVTGLGEDF